VIRFGPALVDLFRNAFHLFPTTEAGILIGGSLPRTQQVLVTENVQRQVAVLVVLRISLEESPFIKCHPKRRAWPPLPLPTNAFTPFKPTKPCGLHCAFAPLEFFQPQ